MSKRIVIIGAGPAGLTAGLELLRQNMGYDVVILEAADSVGGLAKTIDWDDNRFDLGGHRYFSNDQAARDWWDRIMPMPTVSRHSSIYFNGQYLAYPLRFSLDTIRKLGLGQVLQICWSYLRTHRHKAPVASLEDFYIARFGKQLYRLFFHDYTQKVWGKDPALISPEWGPQRMEGVSLSKIISSAFRQHSDEPSLTDIFCFPAQGCGVLWNNVADQIRKRGGQILTSHQVIDIKQQGNRIREVVCHTPTGDTRLAGDLFISSMPLRDLCLSLEEIPADILSVANHLNYRDLIVVGVLLDKSQLQTANCALATSHDQWIYVQNQEVRFGRIQVINNWSERMVKAPKERLLLTLEYFCQAGDALWARDHTAWEDIITTDLKTTGILTDENALLDYRINRVEKAYPCYWDGYAALSSIQDYLSAIDNLVLIGRNGRHQYSNMDDVIINAIRAVQQMHKAFIIPQYTG